MRGVWGISSGQVHVESYDELTWKSGGTETPVDPPDGRGGQDVHDVLPGEGGTAAMSLGGVPGGSSNKNGNAGALRAPTRPRYRGDAGGGKPLPPTVSLV